VPTRSIAPKQLTVLFVGRLQQRKRVDLLIRACAALPPQLQPRLWIVGEGPARAELEALAANVYPRARFWGGLYGSALQPLWLQADLFVLPGTGGLAVQEAMGYALPVIVAEGDGTQDDLVTPETGWQVPPGDLDALQQALLQALGDLPRLRTKGAAAYERVARHVNLDNMVAVFLQAIRSVAD
jgi:glycosyltransferase involved in cell wall biosynthesis